MVNVCRIVTKLNYNRTRLTKNLLVLQQNLVVNIYESTTIKVIIWKDGSKTTLFSGKCIIRTHASAFLIFLSLLLPSLMYLCKCFCFPVQFFSFFYKFNNEALWGTPPQFSFKDKNTCLLLYITLVVWLSGNFDDLTQTQVTILS